MNLVNVMNGLIKEGDYKDYLEIGVGQGNTLNLIKCHNKIGVDIRTKTTADYIMSADEFFEIAYRKTLLFDIVFIDGNHDYEYVKRDIDNSLRHLRPHGTIICHDTLPVSKGNTNEDGWQGMGTAYKAIMDLRMNNPDVVICSIDYGNYEIERGLIPPKDRKYITDSPIMKDADEIETVGVSIIIKGAQSCYESLDLNWSNYEKHKHKLMNILSFSDFKEWFDDNL